MKVQQPDKKYQRDHSIVYSCQYHVVFCPKYRRPVLEKGVPERLKECILEKGYTARTLREEFPTTRRASDDRS